MNNIDHRESYLGGFKTSYRKSSGRYLEKNISPKGPSHDLRGAVEDGIDPEPGQPGLRLRDTLVEVNGTSLMELSDEEW